MLDSYLWSTVLIEFLFDIHGQHLASKRKTFCLFNHLLIGRYCIVTHYHVTLKWKRNHCSKANEWSVSGNRDHDTTPHVCCTPIHCTGTTFTQQENIGGTTTFKQKTVTQLLFGGTYSTRNGWHWTGRNPVRVTVLSSWQLPSWFYFSILRVNLPRTAFNPASEPN